MMLAAWQLSPASCNPADRYGRWAHMLGYGGHCLTKIRMYSVAAEHGVSWPVAMKVWWQLQRLPWQHGCADVAVKGIRDPAERKRITAETEQAMRGEVAQAAVPEAVPEEAGVRRAACLCV